jgi:hypothetical protein
MYAETILWPPNLNKIHKLKFLIEWYITRSVKIPQYVYNEGMRKAKYINEVHTMNVNKKKWRK